MKLKNVLILLTITGCLLIFNSCNLFEKDQNTNVYLKVMTLTGLPSGGSTSGVSEIGTAIIYSDVVHDVDGTSGRYWSDDYGIAEMVMAFVNPDLGATDYPTDYTELTVYQVDVEFLRPDGSAQEGVTVPESFSLSVHVRLYEGLTMYMPFPILTAREKKDEPLVDLYYNGEIQLIARCTFYSRDYQGNEIKPVTAEITVICSNYIDPDSGTTRAALR